MTFTRHSLIAVVLASLDSTPAFAQAAPALPGFSIEASAGTSGVVGGQYRDQSFVALRISGSVGALPLWKGAAGIAVSYEGMGNPFGVKADCLIVPGKTGCVPWEPEVKGLSAGLLWSRRTSTRTLLTLGVGLGTYILDVEGRTTRRAGSYGHADASVQLVGPLAISGTVRTVTLTDPFGARLWYVPVTIGLRLQAPSRS